MLFLCSGISALIYQVLWLRLLGLIFGVTTYAASTVWASFMAGLALGSFGAGRIADRVRRPLMWFGACELLIGATALATPKGLELLQQAYVRIYPSLPPSLTVMTLARFAIAFAMLLFPTALMGATLPLVIKSSVVRSARIGERMALLYGMNTTGAIVGALAAGLYLIPGRGIHGTFLAAASLNLVIGLAALALGTVVIASQDAGDERVSSDVPVALAQLDTGRGRLVLWIFAVSGFTSLALEVVWSRVLTLFLRPTVYGFALMLAAVLAGIAIGSYLVTPFLDRRRPWIAILAGLELAIGVAAVLSFGPLAQMGPVAASLTPALSQVMAEWLVYPAVGSLLAIFPDGAVDGPRLSNRLAAVDRLRNLRRAHAGEAPWHVLLAERGRRHPRCHRSRLLPVAVARRPVVAHRARDRQFRRWIAAPGRVGVTAPGAGGHRHSRDGRFRRVRGYVG